MLSALGPPRGYLEKGFRVWLVVDFFFKIQYIMCNSNRNKQLLIKEIQTVILPSLNGQNFFFKMKLLGMSQASFPLTAFNINY